MEKENLINYLADQINIHKSSYDIGQPIITDTEFDALWQQLRSLSPEHPTLWNTHKSMSCVPGQLAHKFPIYGIQKAFNTSDLNVFLTRFGHLSWRVEPKYDGVAAVLYNNPDGQVLLLYGNGHIGTDISRHIPQINFTLCDMSLPIISCELLITNSNWDKRLGANQRNVAAGRINSQSISEQGLITAVPHRSRLFELINKPTDHTLGELQDFLLACYDSFSEEYPLDGVVIKLSDEEVHIKAGHNCNYYHAIIAWKPPMQTASTVVTDIHWEVSKHGRLIPTVEYTPVVLCSTVNRRVTGNNYKWLCDHKVGIGSHIVVGKAGEIIPKIIRVTKTSAVPIRPLSCPSCGNTDLQVEGVHLVCSSAECLAHLVKRIHHFYSSSAMDLPGIGEAFIEKCLNDNEIRDILIEHPYALLEPLSYGIFSKLLNLFGSKTLDNYLEELKHISGRRTAAHFLTGLATSNMGYRTAIGMLTEYNEHHKIISKKYEKFIVSFYDSIQRLIAFKQMPHNTFKFAPLPRASTIYCITGDLSVPRNEFISYAEKSGWVFQNSVSKNINYLIVGNSPRLTTKKEKALSLGIPIITEQDFYERTSS